MCGLEALAVARRATPPPPPERAPRNASVQGPFASICPLLECMMAQSWGRLALARMLNSPRQIWIIRLSPARPLHGFTRQAVHSQVDTGDVDVLLPRAACIRL